VFYTLRSPATKPFNGLFKYIVERWMNMPVKGLQQSQFLILNAMIISHLVFGIALSA
jgi:hypothetical protein